MTTKHNQQKIRYTNREDSILPVTHTDNERKQPTRFYGLLPLIFFSVGLILLLVILKILMDLLMPV